MNSIQKRKSASKATSSTTDICNRTSVRVNMLYVDRVTLYCKGSGGGGVAKRKGSERQQGCTSQGWRVTSIGDRVKGLNGEKGQRKEA